MTKNYVGANIPKLGFGLMRVPMIEGEIDIAQLKDMVDLYMKAGFTYFDTAYGYVGGRSEVAAWEAIVERYPRESFQLATKFPVWEAKTAEDLPRVFDIQMNRTGAGYFDFYMLHAIGADRLETIDRVGLWDFLKSKKAEGLVRHIGFSFHDNAKVLDEILTAHPEVEFVQLQINYIDWESESVESRKCYEVCMKHHVPVIVMEPVKGGMLAALEGAAGEMLKKANPDASVASWAVRYCASLDHIVTVLSGMSNLDQMKDNLRTMENFIPLTDAERKTLDEVVTILKNTDTIPCTRCEYCTEKCPQNINIPGIFGALNNTLVYGLNATTKGGYHWPTNGRGKASDCIACGVCESRCPQHIEINRKLQDAVEIFES